MVAVKLLCPAVISSEITMLFTLPLMREYLAFRISDVDEFRRSDGMDLGEKCAHKFYGGCGAAEVFKSGRYVTFYERFALHITLGNSFFFYYTLHNKHAFLKKEKDFKDRI